MDPHAARQAKRELYRACHQGLEPDDLAREVKRLIGKVIPFSSSCWHPTDPATGLITGGVSDVPASFIARIGEVEYSESDFNSIADLARRLRPVGILSEETHGRPERSARYRDVLRPMGMERELRAVFVSSSVVWGGARLLRQPRTADFTPQEAGFMADVSRLLAEGFRTSLLIRTVVSKREASDGPGVVLFAANGEVEDISPAAARWIDELAHRCPSSTTVGPLPVEVEHVAARARAISQAVRSPEFGMARSRVLTKSGCWLALHGTVMGRQSPVRTAVIIEPARPAEIAPVILQAYGLTDRERKVTHLVLRGASTTAIADELCISPFTVQDHLKSIFEKMNLKSRGELAGRLFLDQYLPRLLSTSE